MSNTLAYKKELSQRGLNRKLTDRARRDRVHSAHSKAQRTVGSNTVKRIRNRDAEHEAESEIRNYCG